MVLSSAALRVNGDVGVGAKEAPKPLNIRVLV